MDVRTFNKKRKCPLPKMMVHRYVGNCLLLYASIKICGQRLGVSCTAYIHARDGKCHLNRDALRRVARHPLVPPSSEYIYCTFASKCSCTQHKEGTTNNLDSNDRSRRFSTSSLRLPVINYGSHSIRKASTRPNCNRR